MLFKRSSQRYGRTPVPETPYQRAGQLWDERIGSARVQARNWRFMAFGGLALSFALSGGLIWQSAQSRVVPYVVEVDRLGEARTVRPAEAGYRPTNPEIAWHLGRFVEEVRTISLDPVLMRRDWLAAYDFVTPRGAVMLNNYARTVNPFADLGEKTVSVQVTSVVRASDRSFEVKWIETAFDHGAQTSTSHWTGILSIVLKAPSTAEVLRKNPLGIYVDAIDWNKELETPAGPPAAPPPARPPLALPIPNAALSQPESGQATSGTPAQEVQP